MRADELRQAVDRIVEILARADIRGAIDRFRTARGDERTVAAARLGHAGALVMERFEGLGDAERAVVRAMHLQELASPAYWRRVIESSGDPKAAAGELVRLASRVMFATGQLPGLAALLGGVDAGADARHPLGEGEARLVVRLVDAGERASDPDRVARSIDGIDMLYSACASIARKPAMDLRLEAVDGADARDIHLTGERDAVAAVAAVLDSIPDAVAELDEDADVDLDELVRSLPVFEDLATLGSLGSFPESDLKDIAETMHQGALLALESGVARVPPALPPSAPVAVRAVPVPRVPSPEAAPVAPLRDEGPPTLSQRVVPDASPRPGTNGRADGGDRHYDDYLREREAMRQVPQPAAAAPATPPPTRPGTADDEARGEERRDSVEAMLASLGKARGDG